MAAGGPGGAQLPIQQLQALISCGPRSRLTTTLQPFTVDIIDASTQPQAPLQGPGRGGVRDTGGQLLIQQLGHQSPGLADRCQLQGPLDDRIPLLLGQAAGQLRRPAPARCRRRTRLTAGEQHHRSPPGLPQVPAVPARVAMLPLMSSSEGVLPGAQDQPTMASRVKVLTS